MTTRDRAPRGAPCWIDLWTSDVDGSRAFYSELLGWEAQEPSPEFGGYFMFTLNGQPVAGGMGDMGDMKADNNWKIYLQTDDIETTLKAATDKGATVMSPAMPVADLGIQAVLTDPTGAAFGTWQPGTFQGFSATGEHGAPSWFELHTKDHAKAVDFYESVFHWKTQSVSDTDEFRYTLMLNPDGEGELAGMMDASTFLPAGETSHWSVYWHVDDADAAASLVEKLGGTMIAAPEDTPYGRISTAADPTGAQFRLRTAID